MMKAVFFADHAFEAHLMRGLLEVEGIRAEVRGEWLAGACGELPASGLVTVWVEDADLERAGAVLAQAAEFDASDLDSPEDEAAWGHDRGVIEA